MDPIARRHARQYALQALYAWQLSNNLIEDIEQQLLNEQNRGKLDVDYLHDLLIGVTQRQKILDQIMAPYLSRAVHELDPIEKAILRLSLYELLQRHDVPYKVVISEAVELAKSFGAQESHRFINGALDKIAIDVRLQRDGSHSKDPLCQQR